MNDHDLEPKEFFDAKPAQHIQLKPIRWQRAWILIKSFFSEAK